MLGLSSTVLIGLGLVAVGVLVFDPGPLGAAAPILIALACPFVMLAMMWAKGSGEGQRSESPL